MLKIKLHTLNVKIANLAVQFSPLVLRTSKMSSRPYCISHKRSWYAKSVEGQSTSLLCVLQSKGVNMYKASLVVLNIMGNWVWAVRSKSGVNRHKLMTFWDFFLYLSEHYNSEDNKISEI